MDTVVLCAGLGTRLEPLSTWVAKPLVPVGDRPALAQILERVRVLGGPIAVNAHHHAAQVRAFVEAEAPGVVVSEEDALLDTGGGVKRALEVLGARRSAAAEGVLVWNGDALIALDLPGLRDAHLRGAGPAGATLAVRAATDRGNVGLDADGRVVRMRGETLGPGEVRGVDFLGIHIIGEGLLDRLPVRGGLVEGFYLPLLAEGVVLRVFETAAPFHDIGTLASYRAANLAWLAETGRSSFVAPGAHVADRVTLEASIVGRDASVEGEGVLVRCVVWPGAKARAPLEGAVVTPFGVVAD